MAPVNYNTEGIVFDIQRYSIHDGPGIRTIVFLKGCPLSCFWCSNPESQQLAPNIMFQQERCISCGKCLSACPTGALSTEHPGTVDYQKCVGCGECANVCPTGALVLKGEKTRVEELVRILKKDAITYRKSGGGITLSGGEPLVQWEFSVELLKACKAQGWHTAMETAGFGSETAVEAVFPLVDLTLLDIKSTDSRVHKKYTGATNDVILSNAARITRLSKTIVRVPTIPGVNAFDEEFVNIAQFAKTLHGVDTIHILPYHTYGENKYSMMGKEYKMDKKIKALQREDVKKYQKILQSQGFNCEIGG